MKPNFARAALFGLVLLLPSAWVLAGQLEQDKKQVAFINRTMGERQSLIRKQLAAGKLELAEKNIRGMTEQLADLARLTKRIRASQPGYSPNPPLDFKATPAASRKAEYTKAKKLAIAAGKQLNKDAQAANAALLKAKSRQLATIPAATGPGKLLLAASRRRIRMRHPGNIFFQ